MKVIENYKKLLLKLIDLAKILPNFKKKRINWKIN